jgi:hypothetical protein
VPRASSWSLAEEWIVSVGSGSTLFVHFPFAEVFRFFLLTSIAEQTPSISLTNPTTELPVPTTLYTLNLHTAPISSVRSRNLPLTSTPTASPHLLTAGWDGVVGVWDLTPGVNEGEPQEDGSERKKKRRKQAPGTVIVKVGLAEVL